MTTTIQDLMNQAYDKYRENMSHFEFSINQFRFGGF